MKLYPRSHATLFLAAIAVALMPVRATAADRPPNILFVILDDIGIDQLGIFNPRAATPPSTPTMDTLASSGVRFQNFFTMPECSPSRACFFTGRYPLRTGVTAAILELDLPGAQLSRYEITTPRVLAGAGYRNAMIGKFHLAGPDNNPDGFGTPNALGWEYFNGGLHGAPAHVDPTLGGQYPEDTTRYAWGFPIGTQRGVGWFLTPTNTIRCDDNDGTGYTGKEIATLGGIPALDADGEFARSCESALSSGRTVSFSGYNGYYAWPKVINDGTNVIRSIERQYATTDQTDEAIAWIQQQSAGQAPWMCTVSYSSIHTPYQPPPDHLYPPGFTWPSQFPEASPDDLGAIKVVSDLMIAAVDRELGRLLVETGLATRGPEGQLIYEPSASDTMIVVVGDNGTFLFGVNYPYNPVRSKGTPYETGIRAPLIIAGPMVTNPGRAVEQLVSCVDLFQLFGEIAGVDVREAVPAAHVLDSRPMLGYLTNANQAPIRSTVFAQNGNGEKAPQNHLWPTVLSVGPANIATDILFTSQTLAEAEGGTWYGPGGSQVFFSACDLREANIYTNLTIVPTRFWTIRNERYKLIKLERAPCDASLGEYEFYDLTPTPLNPVNPLGLDNAEHDLLNNGLPVNLTPEQQANFDELKEEMENLLASEIACRADGDLDKQVTQADIDGVLRYWGQPSWFDVNRDGITDQTDLDCVTANLGGNCLQNPLSVDCPTPSYLNQPQLLSSGEFQFLFTGPPGASFIVVASPDLTRPSAEWTVIGPVTETSPGRFEFKGAPDNSQLLFYQVRTP